VAEYFVYNLRNIDEEVIEKLSDDNCIIAELFKIYQEYEQYQINTWKEIEELIDAYICSIKTAYENNEKETIIL